MKKGLILSIYSPGRESLQHELEASLHKDLENFNFLKLDPVSSVYEVSSRIAEGYDYALRKGYDFVSRIDDDDLVVPGAFGLLATLLNQKPKAMGFSGRQIAFRSEKPNHQISKDAQLLFNPHYYNFHGVTLYRTQELYPIVNEWRNIQQRDQHRSLAKMLMEQNKTLGFTNSAVSYYRLKDENGNYYS